MENVDDELKNKLTKIDSVKDCFQKPFKPDK